MDPIVVFMTIIGICLIVASFIFLDQKENSKKQVVTLNDYELDEQELAKLQESIKKVVKEYSDELVADTNKQLNEISSAKMMEINELCEQALSDIQKAHQECVFLYDMLEDKSENLKQYVSNSAQKLFSMQEDVMRVASDDTEKEKQQPEQETNSQVQNYLLEHVKQSQGEEEKKHEEDTLGIEEVQKRNEQILAMDQAGSSPLDIAKKLDMGVGEVKLVVGLFQGEQDK